MHITDIEYQQLRKFLLKETGIDVPEAKQYLFATRLGELLEKEGCASFTDFLVLLTCGKESLVRSTIEAMTTHESGFYREPQHFQVLVENIFPDLIARKAAMKSHTNPCVRILSAGCSFGQEPYSVAMAIARVLPLHPTWSHTDFSITGVDISTRALERAKHGKYTDLEVGGNLSGEDQKRYFTHHGDYWILHEALRKCVEFKHMNLSMPLIGLGKFDVILCRNMLIYFSPEQKTAVLKQLRDALEPQGVLFIGATESMYGTGVPFVHRTIGQSSHYEAPATPNISEGLSWKF